MDRNLVATPAVLVTTGSLSARRAWIEMLILVPVLVPLCVALRKESVDRNTNTISDYLRANVALRKESVDRNKGDQGHISGDEQSLSARRAWIEIWYWGLRQFFRPVALRKESVDRNIEGKSLNVKSRASLSARRAWIEISRG